MNNWLIGADVHIDDYPSYNKTKRARLKQFIKLAHRFNELGDEYGCTTLVLAGDTLNRPNNRPYVVNVINQFLEIISKKFKKVYYIYGQHDMDSKSIRFDPEDTILTALQLPNFEYMDRKIITTDSGKLIAFKDWNPVQDLSWIDGKVDLLIAHYTKSGLFGQEIDESKFDLMIHGDIHNSQEIGKFISIGNPIQLDMGSQKDGTCIVLNPETCEWKRIQVDPDHSRFLRLHYTKNRDEEGFADDLNYYIYKPTAVSSSSDNIKSQLPDWNEIDDLIANLVQDKGLGTVHSEVLSKNPHYTETDFNFSLKRLKVHGYRSIVDFELNFDGNDRIILIGDNGSGKSSVVKSLKSIFEKSRNIAYEKSDFTDSARIDLEFMYQSKMYHVWRGTNDWGMEIDSKELTYNNKTEFENDICNQLPFMNYVDLFFIASDVSNLSDKFSPSRRIDLLSKFYRLDRVAAYRETSDKLALELTDQLRIQKSELDKLSGQSQITKQRLSELEEYKDKQKSEFESEVNRLNELRQNYMSHLNWSHQVDQLNSQIKLIKDQINDYDDRLKGDLNSYQESVDNTKKRIDQLSELLKELSNDAITLVNLTKELTQVTENGKKVAKQLESIDLGFCPTCGAKLENLNSIKLKTELTQLRDQLRTRYGELTNSIANLGRDSFIPHNGWDAVRYKSEIDSGNDSLRSLQIELRKYENLVALYNQALSDKSNIELKYQDLNNQLIVLNSKEPPYEQLPIDFDSQLMKATSNLARFDEYERLTNQLLEIETGTKFIESKIKDIESNLDQYYAYSHLLSSSGDVMYSVLSKMATAFSDNSIEYRVDRGVYRNKEYIEFNEFLNVKGNWRPYNSLSAGQSTIADLDFLKKLFSVRSGLLVLDEYLKHLDDKYGPIAWTMLRDMNVNSIIISTHDANFTNYTKKVELSLDSEGHTVSEII